MSEQIKEIRCPNCNSLMYFYLDEWGRTPWHLHCNNCRINIGTTNKDKAIELVKTHHEPNTYIEYYDNKIQLLLKG